MSKKMLDIATQVLRDEADALLAGAENLNGDELEKIVDLIYHSDSRLIVLGVGKSGLIGTKIAATLASTGTPSFFIHPTEAMHGDLGMIKQSDIILAISYSGESDELVALMPHLKRLSHKVITMTKNKDSSISKFGDYFLDISVEREACCLNTAPTSSTTLTLALGDALAVCLMKKRGFEKNDFASFHPGGSLGRKLFVKIKDLMQSENLPIVAKNVSIKNAINAMSAGKLGCVIICEDSSPIGIFSDGDLRRALEDSAFSLEKNIMDYATLNPRICDDENALAYDILKIIEDSKIQLLIITDKKRQLKGVVHLHKLVEAGIK